MKGGTNLNKKLIEKINKILALGENNPNEEERQSALNKAAELLKEHNLSMEDLIVSKKSDIEEHNIIGDTQKCPQWKTMLVAEITNLFDCYVLLSYPYIEDFNYEKKYMFKIIGYKKDRELAIYFYKHIESWIRTSIFSIRNTGENINSYQYSLGVSIVVIKRLKELYEKKEEVSSNCKDLMVIKKDNVQKHIEDNYNTSKKRVQPKISKRDDYIRGLADGRKVPLHSGILTGNQQQSIDM